MYRGFNVSRTGYRIKVFYFTFDIFFCWWDATLESFNMKVIRMNPLAYSLRFPNSPKIDKTSFQRSGNTSLATLQKNLQDLQAQRLTLLSQLNEKHPDISASGIMDQLELLVFRIERKQLEINQFWTTVYRLNSSLPK